MVPVFAVFVVVPVGSTATGATCMGAIDCCGNTAPLLTVVVVLVVLVVCS